MHDDDGNFLENGGLHADNFVRWIWNPETYEQHEMKGPMANFSGRSGRNLQTTQTISPSLILTLTLSTQRQRSIYKFITTGSN